MVRRAACAYGFLVGSAAVFMLPPPNGDGRKSSQMTTGSASYSSVERALPCKPKRAEVTNLLIWASFRWGTGLTAPENKVLFLNALDLWTIGVPFCIRAESGLAEADGKIQDAVASHVQVFLALIEKNPKRLARYVSPQTFPFADFSAGQGKKDCIQRVSEAARKCNIKDLVAQCLLARLNNPSGKTCYVSKASIDKVQDCQLVRTKNEGDALFQFQECYAFSNGEVVMANMGKWLPVLDGAAIDAANDVQNLQNTISAEAKKRQEAIWAGAKEAMQQQQQQQDVLKQAAAAAKDRQSPFITNTAAKETMQLHSQNTTMKRVQQETSTQDNIEEDPDDWLLDDDEPARASGVFQRKGGIVQSHVGDKDQTDIFETFSDDPNDKQEVPGKPGKNGSKK